jgi:hypothetical protein
MLLNIDEDPNIDNLNDNNTITDLIMHNMKGTSDIFIIDSFFIRDFNSSLEAQTAPSSSNEK